MAVPLETLVKDFTELLEVAIHGILHARGVYPAALFDLRQFQGVGTASARHPQLREYIGRVLSGARDLLVDGQLDAFIVTLSIKDRVVERFVWRIHESDQLQHTRREHLELPSRDLCRYVQTSLSAAEVRSESQAMLLRTSSFLSDSKDLLNQLNQEDLTWSLAVKTNQIVNQQKEVKRSSAAYRGPADSIDELTKEAIKTWIPVDAFVAESISDSRLTLIRSCDYGPFCWELYSESIS